MPMPKSVTKVNKNGVKFISSVDRTKYTLAELERAALRDVGKLLRKAIKARVPVEEGVLKKNVGTWVKKFPSVRLQIGVYDKQRSDKKGYPYAYHAHLVQFGARGGKMPATDYLRAPVLENINQIRVIQGQYLKAIENENKAKGLLDESEEIADD